MTHYIDESTGATAETVYVTTVDGDEIGSYEGHVWGDDFIARMESKHGTIRATFQGGDLDGYEAI